MTQEGSARRPSDWVGEQLFVPKVCPTRDYVSPFWSIPDYDDRMRATFDSKTLRVLAWVVF